MVIWFLGERAYSKAWRLGLFWRSWLFKLLHRLRKALIVLDSFVNLTSRLRLRFFNFVKLSLLIVLGWILLLRLFLGDSLRSIVELKLSKEKVIGVLYTRCEWGSANHLLLLLLIFLLKLLHELLIGWFFSRRLIRNYLLLGDDSVFAIWWNIVLSIYFWLNDLCIVLVACLIRLNRDFNLSGTRTALFARNFKWESRQLVLWLLFFGLGLLLYQILGIVVFDLILLSIGLIILLLFLVNFVNVI